MPSVFDTAYKSAAVPGLFATFGEAATYKRDGADDVSLWVARTNIGVNRERTGDTHGRTTNYQQTFIITADAATATYGGVASPIKGARLVVGADTWTITEIESDGVLHECFCNRSVPNEMSHPKYRHAAPVRGRR